MSDTVTCPDCRGTGDVGGNPSYGPCERCNRTGKIPYLPTHPLSEAGTSVEVKPLVWLDDVAIGAARLRYSVSKPSFTPGWRAWVQAIDAYGGAPVGGTIVTMTAADEADAKALCQADYEARIRSALIQRTPAETEGDWVLVPREPTHEMLVHRFEYTNELSRADVWSAMLAASPTPPPIGDGEGPKPVAWMHSEADWVSTSKEEIEAHLRRGYEAIPLYPASAIESLSRQLEEAREAERKRAIAAIHWVFSADGTKTERSMADDAINKINDPDFAPIRAKETVSHG